MYTITLLSHLWYQTAGHRNIHRILTKIPRSDPLKIFDVSLEISSDPKFRKSTYSVSIFDCRVISLFETVTGSISAAVDQMVFHPHLLFVLDVIFAGRRKENKH